MSMLYKRPVTRVRYISGTPLSVMACVWRMPVWQKLHAAANRVGKDIMLVVLKDKEVLPVNRYMADADALKVFLGKPGGRVWDSQLTISQTALIAYFSTAVKQVQRDVAQQYQEHFEVRTDNVLREVMSRVLPVQFQLPLAGVQLAGNVPTGGNVVHRTEWWRICFRDGGNAV